MKTTHKILFLLLIPVLGFSQSKVDSLTKIGKWKPVRADEIRFTDQFRPVDPYSITYSDSNDFVLRSPIPYAFVRSADVMWSKVAWEMIDLREKMNQPIYFPTDTTMQNRKSLIMAIREGINSYKIDAYKASLNASTFEFKDYIDADSVRKLGSVVTQLKGKTNIDWWQDEEIKQILVKEVWYFDRKASKLKSEIIGLCFIRDYNRAIGVKANGIEVDYDPQSRSEQLFWIYYPQARDFLARIPVYNPYNSTDQYSFDDLFVNRKFKSFFVREANVYNDRLITKYYSDREAQLESERIKKEIFDYEQDLWEN